jgi:hypothetical protein
MIENAMKTICSRSIKAANVSRRETWDKLDHFITIQRGGIVTVLHSRHTIDCPCYGCIVSAVCRRDRDCAAYESFYARHSKFCLPIYRQYYIRDGEDELEVVNFCSDISPDRFCPLLSPHMKSVSYTEDNIYFNMEGGKIIRLIDPQRMVVYDKMNEFKELYRFIHQEEDWALSPPGHLDPLLESLQHWFDARERRNDTPETGVLTMHGGYNRCRQSP